MKVRWTPNAKADLKAIRARIAHDSPRYATETIDRITRRTTILESQPLIGSIVEELDSDYRELLELRWCPFSLAHVV